VPTPACWLRRDQAQERAPQRRSPWHAAQTTPQWGRELGHAFAAYLPERAGFVADQNSRAIVQEWSRDYPDRIRTAPQHKAHCFQINRKWPIALFQMTYIRFT